MARVKHDRNSCDRSKKPFKFKPLKDNLKKAMDWPCQNPVHFPFDNIAFIEIPNIEECRKNCVRHKEKSINKDNFIPAPAVKQRCVPEDDKDEDEVDSLGQQVGENLNEEVGPVLEPCFHILPGILEKHRCIKHGQPP